MCYPTPLIECNPSCKCDDAQMFCRSTFISEKRWCNNDGDCLKGWTCKDKECYFENNSTCSVQETPTKCGNRYMCPNSRCERYTPECWRNDDCQGTGLSINF